MQGVPRCQMRQRLAHSPRRADGPSRPQVRQVVATKVVLAMRQSLGSQVSTGAKRQGVPDGDKDIAFPCPRPGSIQGHAMA